MKVRAHLKIFIATLGGLSCGGVSAQSLVVPLFRLDVDGSSAKAERVQICKQGDPCEITVSVKPHPKHPKKRCIVKVDKPILIVTGAAARSLVWRIVPQGGDTYRFDPKTGIDVAGNDDDDPADREFDDGIADESKLNYTVGHRKRGGNVNQGYSYNVTVQRKDDSVTPSTWNQCGSVDPVIINRD